MEVPFDISAIFFYTTLIFKLFRLKLRQFSADKEHLEMDQQLAAEILTGDSEEIEDLKSNLPLLEGFIQLARRLDASPQIGKRFYEESRSFYQATCTNLPIAELEKLLAEFFGPAAKSADKPLPRKLRKNGSVKYLGGIEKDQALFLLPLKTGEFYGTLWPWRRNKTKIEIHLGYSSDWISDEDYQKLDTLFKKSLNHSAFQQMDTQAGGQIRGIGLPSFLQMAEMEQATFTLKVACSGETGNLHVKEGQLIAAETGELNGRLAAYCIIGWEDVVIEIAPADTSQTDNIQQPLMHVLMESLKTRDEIAVDQDDRIPQPKPQRPKPGSARPSKRLVRLERAPGPRAQRKGINFLLLLGIALGISIIGGSGIVATMYFLDNRGVPNLYEQLLDQVEKADSPEQKMVSLQSFIQANPHSPHAAQVQSLIDQVRHSIEEREFDQITLKISSMQLDEDYEKKAIQLYGDFMEKHPGTELQQRITAAIADIKNLMDQYYYEELKRAARLDFSARLQAYKQYLARFPQGRFHQDVAVLITEMGSQYLNFMKKEDTECEQKQRWDDCIERYQRFLADYSGTSLGEEAMQAARALQDKRDMLQLRQLEADSGSNYAKANQAYVEYLEAHAQTTQKQAIEDRIKALQQNLKIQRQWEAVRSYASNSNNALFDRIQRLESYLHNHQSSPYVGEAQGLMNQLEYQRQTMLQQSQLEAQRQVELLRQKRQEEKKEQQQHRAQQLRQAVEQQLSTSKRYKVNDDGTATDLSTGLTWMILDSFQELGGCADYQAARQYVQNITVGNQRHWRLPTAGELAAILKQTPYFPSTEAQWYWTSESYIKGYHAMVDVVSTKRETVFQRQQRNQNECGAVRAVSP